LHVKKGKNPREATDNEAKRSKMCTIL